MGKMDHVTLPEQRRQGEQWVGRVCVIMDGFAANKKAAPWWAASCFEFFVS
jgi:hypothetical protein